jgi:hypothetical protein
VDTGANCGATNNLDILWNYQGFTTLLRITTYDDHSDKPTGLSAIGTGGITIETKDNQILPCTILYAPGSTGTILTPDRITRDTPQTTDYFIHGGQRKNMGSISFADTYGLWHVTDPVLIPPKNHTVNHLKLSTIRLQCHPTNQPTSTPPPCIRHHHLLTHLAPCINYIKTPTSQNTQESTLSSSNFTPPTSTNSRLPTRIVTWTSKLSSAL